MLNDGDSLPAFDSNSPEFRPSPGPRATRAAFICERGTPAGPARTNGGDSVPTGNYEIAIFGTGPAGRLEAVVLSSQSGRPTVNVAEPVGKIFGDHMPATAMVDRLIHHAEILSLKGDSHRLRGKEDARPQRRALAD